jgi:hypothetical protein
LSSQGQSSLERFGVNRALEETPAHTPPGDHSVEFQRRAN